MLHLPHLHNWFSTVLMLESHMRKPERWTDGKRFHSGQLYNIHSFTIENNFNDLQKQTTITYMYYEYWKTNPKWQANRFYKYVRQDTPHPSQSISHNSTGLLTYSRTGHSWTLLHQITVHEKFNQYQKHTSPARKNDQHDLHRKVFSTLLNKK